MSQLPRLIIAAPMSGSGKTTITSGIIAALAGRGIQVAPFKCGPDYIDPSYHSLAAGRTCANLDAWLLPPDLIPSLLVKRSAGAEIAIIEGVMGLFDGRAGAADLGSTAHIARLTATPVIIVLDVRGMALTAAALVAGLRDFDPRIHIAGVILNRVAGARHAKMVSEAIEEHVRIPVLGYLLRDSELTLPERHLGLVPVEELKAEYMDGHMDGHKDEHKNEQTEWLIWLSKLRRQIESSIDLDKLVALASSAPPLPEPSLPVSTLRPFSDHRPTIAVARDEAFTFRYEDNIELLAAAGAEIAYFSPIHDSQLPPKTSAIYLCGGFPEIYAESLSQNKSMLAAIRSAANARLPIYAECGGLIYLSEGVTTANGHHSPLAALIPGHTVMTSRLTMGYRELRAGKQLALAGRGNSTRPRISLFDLGASGQEFFVAIRSQIQER